MLGEPLSTAPAMTTLTPETLEARFVALESSYNLAVSRLASLEAEHKATHDLLQASRIATAALEHQMSKVGNNGGSKGFRLIDPKTMVPAKLSGRDQWRGWSEASRSYVENLDTKLADHLLSVEGHPDPLTPDQILETAVNDEHVQELGRYLKLRTEPDSHANTW